MTNSAPVLVWMSDTAKLRTFFNQGWLTFTGRSLKQELGNGWVAAVHPDDRHRTLETYSSSFDALEDFQMEYRLRRSDGVYRWLVDFGAPRFESSGPFAGYVGSCIDITDRKAFEESAHNLTGRLITAQEEERNRIARELHDDFSQRLAFLSAALGQLWKRLAKSGSVECASVQKILDETDELCSDLHTLSHQLHSSKLDHVGLVAALVGLCKEMGQKYKVAIHFTQQQCPSEIPKDVALCMFRVAQEALGNVVRHSDSTEAQVELRGSNGHIVLRISDQGKGFDPGLRDSTAGIGIIGMTERLRFVGGKLSVNSKPNRGTEIIAEVPLAAEYESHRKNANCREVES